MSIYMSTFSIGDEHSRHCTRITKIGRMLYQQDESKDCTCGSCPIEFQGSHILPSNRDRRRGCLSLGAIPGHIAHGKRKAVARDFLPYHPWLRVSIWDTAPDDPTVVLTRKQVKSLRNELTRWLKNLPKGKQVSGPGPGSP